MKIVVIGPVYPYKGGIAHYTSMLTKSLAKEHEVELISYKMQYPKFLFKKEQKDYTNELFKIDDARFWINTANPFNIIASTLRIRKLKPDMVLFQWWHPYFAPCYFLMEKVLGKKIFKAFTCHNVFPHERFPMDKKLSRLVLKSGDGFVVQSGSDEADLLSIKPDANYKYNPHPTYNAFKQRNITRSTAVEEIIEKDGFDITQDTKLLLFFGFVRDYKGLKFLLQAMPKIKENLPDCKLLVVGSFGDDKDDYMTLIDELRIADCLCLKDTYTADNEVEKYFAASDLMVLPYVDATQSGIVQIAFGFEKPCLVTRVGGLPDVVTDGKTGYLVEPQNPDQIAEAVIDYFQNNRFDDMHEHIQAEAKVYSWENMVKTIEEISRRDR